MMAIVVADYVRGPMFDSQSIQVEDTECLVAPIK